MNPIKSKHIVIGLAVAFILFLFYRIGDEDYSYEQPGTQTHLQSEPSDVSYGYEQVYPTSSTWSHNQPIPTRHEVLQAKVKGYREETYWGEQSSIDDKVKQMSKDEFNRFIEETELKDADVYWGATY